MIFWPPNTWMNKYNPSHTAHTLLMLRWPQPLQNRLFSRAVNVRHPPQGFGNTVFNNAISYALVAGLALLHCSLNCWIHVTQNMTARVPAETSSLLSVLAVHIHCMFASHKPLVLSSLHTYFSIAMSWYVKSFSVCTIIFWRNTITLYYRDHISLSTIIKAHILHDYILHP